MNTYEIVWNDKHGNVRRTLIEAPDPREAKRILYRELGVKRLVGVRTDRIEP